MKKKTKIIATISDMKCDVDFIKQLYEKGMNAVRLNTAHQSPEDTLKVINNVRQVSERIALILDTKGPELRTTKAEDKIILNKGDKVIVKGDPEKKSTKETIYVNYDKFVNEVSKKDVILIDDGFIELQIQDKKGDELHCLAMNNGSFSGKKSVNVPDAKFSLPSLSKKDKDYIEFAIEHDIDFIAHSFVRNKKDVEQLQKLLDAKKSRIKIIAKIENQEGVDNLDEILENVYGIMVARGDLAIEIPYEKIPGIQKMIINKCIAARKPVIIATQMLHSMIKEPRPTRAEVSDIANAIYSKADTIMLSGETAFGDYPVEAVETMAKIALEVEKSRSDVNEVPIKVMSTETSAFLSKTAVEASIKLDAEAIIADTSTGRTIRNIAGYRGRKVVYAQCYDKRVMRELAISFGVYSNYQEPDEIHAFIRESLSCLVKKQQLKETDRIVVLGGNFGMSHGASFIEISTVKNLMKSN
ncbi:MAG: pyruvate kinase [Bacteroidales bacterium]|nr:pyruvate kinase [Bacteroidales bacterium]